MATVEENRKELIGQRFGREGQIEIISLGEQKHYGAFYKVKCHKCAEDVELFGDAIFQISIGSLKAGCMPCGCNTRHQYSDLQFRILISRLFAENLDYEFLGFSDIEVTRPTKLKIRCKKDGNTWEHLSVRTALSKGISCTSCREFEYKTSMIGQEFTLNCGEIVKITEYCSSKIVNIVDKRGNTKTATIGQIRRGIVSWPWCESDFARWSKYKVGQEFSLNCGVKVKIAKLLKNSKAVVSDPSGNTRTCAISHLVIGDTNWYVDGKSVRAIASEESKKIETRFPLGSRWESTTFGWLTITGYNIGNNTLTIRWDNTGFEQQNVYSGHITEGCVKDSSITRNKTHLPFKPLGYYVYIASIDGEIFYIGSGKGDRYSHVNSGISHNYKINLHHFTAEQKLSIAIYREGMSKDESRELETNLILQLNPKYNYKKYAGGL